MYSYLTNPENRLNNAVRKLEEISNHLSMIKGCSTSDDYKSVIEGLRWNIKKSKEYLIAYKNLSELELP